MRHPPPPLDQCSLLCRHFKRVVRYARPADYATWAGTTAFVPGALWLMERVHPSGVGRGGFAPMMRLATAIGFGSGFILLTTLSSCAYTPGRVWGFCLWRKLAWLQCLEFPPKSFPIVTARDRG